MSKEEFDYVLAWIIFLNGIPPFFSAIVCALWWRLVKRTFSKAVCGTGFVIFFLMGTIRIVTAYEFDNQTIRILNGFLFMFGGIVANVILAWSYWRRYRESKLLTSNQLERIETPFREYVSSSVKHLSMDTIGDLVAQLKDSDKAKLMQKFTKLRY